MSEFVIKMDIALSLFFNLSHSLRGSEDYRMLVFLSGKVDVSFITNIIVENYFPNHPGPSQQVLNGRNTHGRH